MTKRNLPPYWPRIREVALSLGATDWAIRKWLDRGAVPGDWQVRIFKETAGGVPLDAMSFTSSRLVNSATMQQARLEEALDGVTPECAP